jgi:hypothetical protein
MRNETTIESARRALRKIKPSTRRNIFIGLVVAVVAARKWRFLPALAALKGWDLPLRAYKRLRGGAVPKRRVRTRARRARPAVHRRHRAASVHAHPIPKAA